MKIIGIKIDGLRKLTAVEIEFADKGLIQFRGKNKQGKTTILDSFEILLRGNKCVENDMITHGKMKAEIIGTVGDYEIKRVITAKSNRIEVKHKDDGVVARPQEFLDTLINELTFNPRPFLNKTYEQKLQFMMDFLKIDFTAVDGKIKDAEEERLVIGRIIKRYGELKPVEKVERVVIGELISKRDNIIFYNDKETHEYERLKDSATKDAEEFNEYQGKLKSNIEITKDRLAELDEKKKEIETELEEVLAAISDTKNLLDTSPLPEPEKSLDVDVEEPELKSHADIDIEISFADERNIQAEAYEIYSTKKKEKAEEEAKYEDYTTKLDKLRNVKKMIFRNAKIPIVGLTIRESGVYYNSIHSENWAESEALKISCKLCIAMKPKLQALFLDFGESFDSDSIEELKNWAEDNDIQFFLTTVCDSKGISEESVFYIEDGSVV